MWRPPRVLRSEAKCFMNAQTFRRAFPSLFFFGELMARNASVRVVPCFSLKHAAHLGLVLVLRHHWGIQGPLGSPSQVCWRGPLMALKIIRSQDTRIPQGKLFKEGMSGKACAVCAVCA